MGESLRGFVSAPATSTRGTDLSLVECRRLGQVDGVIFIRSMWAFAVGRLRASDAAIEAYLESFVRHPMADAPRDGSVVHVGLNSCWMPVRFNTELGIWEVTFASTIPLAWDEIKDREYRVFPAVDKEQVKS